MESCLWTVPEETGTLLVSDLNKGLPCPGLQALASRRFTGRQSCMFLLLRTCPEPGSLAAPPRAGLSWALQRPPQGDTCAEKEKPGGAWHAAGLGSEWHLECGVPLSHFFLSCDRFYGCAMFTVAPDLASVKNENSGSRNPRPRRLADGGATNCLLKAHQPSGEVFWRK